MNELYFNTESLIAGLIVLIAFIILYIGKQFPWQQKKVDKTKPVEKIEEPTNSLEEVLKTSDDTTKLNGGI